MLIGTNGRSRDILEREFPNLTFVSLPEYDIRYPESGAMSFQMLIQLPGLIKTILKERTALQKLIKKYSIDAVISDNRFGLGSRRVFSVYMTHQIAIRAPEKLKWVEPLLYWLHKLVMKNYQKVWIPDYENEPNLSGDLSHGNLLQDNFVYVGPLSRFNQGNDESEKVGAAGIDETGHLPAKIDILAILSGPEPQRSIFEEIILKQLKNRPEEIFILRGTPEENTVEKRSTSFTILNHLPSKQLERIFLRSGIVIARAGYSTIMDLATTGKKAILIPTPGQTEQEYLAESLMQKGLFYSETQDKFDINRALREVVKFSGINFQTENPVGLRDAIEDMFKKELNC